MFNKMDSMGDYRQWATNGLKSVNRKQVMKFVEQSDREHEEKNSLTYWLNNHKDRFTDGVFRVSHMCISTRPCHHYVELRWKTEQGDVKSQPFGSYDTHTTIQRACTMSKVVCWINRDDKSDDMSSDPRLHFNKTKKQ